MSRTHQDGHGRCGACGDAGECRRDREDAWHRADDEDVKLEPVIDNDCPPWCRCDDCLEWIRIEDELLEQGLIFYGRAPSLIVSFRDVFRLAA